jgi:hypothetical protein
MGTHRVGDYLRYTEHCTTKLRLLALYTEPVSTAIILQFELKVVLKQIKGGKGGRFNFTYGSTYWLRKYYSGPTRVLPVRNIE